MSEMTPEERVGILDLALPGLAARQALPRLVDALDDLSRL